MNAYLLSEDSLKPHLSRSSRTVDVGSLQRFCQSEGEELTVLSWGDNGLLLAGDALQGLPVETESLYGCSLIHGHRVDAIRNVVGYATASQCVKALESWPEPDSDDPQPEVLAAREELEGWLRRAAKRSKSLVIFWH